MSHTGNLLNLAPMPKVVKYFLMAFFLCFVAVVVGSLLHIGALVQQSRAELLVDCVVAATLGTPLMHRFTALLDAPYEEKALGSSS